MDDVGNQKPVSLHPLSAKEALADLLKVKPEKSHKTGARERPNKAENRIKRSPRST